MDFEERSVVLAPFEMAARIVCKEEGVDPDARVSIAHPLIKGAKVSYASWLPVAEELMALSTRLHALQRAERAKRAAAAKEVPGGAA